MNRTILGVFAVLLITGASRANTYYASSTSGSDANSGSLSSPFRTLDKCVTSLSAGDTCDLRAGTYLTSGATVSNSGTKTSPIVVQGHTNEQVVIRQGSILTWTRSSGNIWSAPYDSYYIATAKQNARTSFYERGLRLWNDATPLPEASFPNLSGGANSFHTYLTAESGTSSTLIKNSKIPAVDLTGARVALSASFHETVHTRPVLSYAGGQVGISSDGWDATEGASFYLEGSKNLIDTAWEWAWDTATNKVWLQTDGTDPNTLPIRVQSSSAAFVLNNVSWWIVHDLTLQGVVPVPSGTITNIQYHHLTVHEAGILRWNEAIWDFKQHAGIVLGDNSRLHHSIIDGCDGRCVDLFGQADTVDNNVFTNGTRMGQYEGTISIEKPYAVVARNDIFNSGHDGIGFMTTTVEKPIIRRNWITGAGQTAADAAGITIGPHAGNASIGGATIDSNLVSGTLGGGAGVFLDQSSAGNDVFHNIFANQGVGVVFKCYISQGNFSSKNNRVGNNTGVNLNAFAYIRQIVTFANSFVDDNILGAGLVSGAYESYPLAYSATTASAYPSLGWTGNLPVGTDALLKDVANRDYSLSVGSPAIDYGSVYLTGQTYQGTAPDAGAIESGTKPWVFGLYDDTVITPCNPALCFEDPSLWTVSWNSGTATKTTSTDRVQGSYALSLTPNGYIPLETPNLTQAVASGFNMLQFSIKLSTVSNPWWYGQVQFFFECPSLGIYNQWVGQVELTGKPLGTWNTLAVTIPSWLGSQLAGKTFSDFKVRMAVNIPSGSGPVLFDYLRLLP